MILPALLFAASFTVTGTVSDLNSAPASPALPCGRQIESPRLPGDDLRVYELKGFPLGSNFGPGSFTFTTLQPVGKRIPFHYDLADPDVQYQVVARVGKIRPVVHGADAGAVVVDSTIFSCPRSVLANPQASLLLRLWRAVTP